LGSSNVFGEKDSDDTTLIRPIVAIVARNYLAHAA
jgi:hypothetical protein